MRRSRLIKIYILYPILALIAILLDYTVAVCLSKYIVGHLFPDNEFITFYESSISAILAAIVPLLVLYIQLRTSHNQFTYVQKKNDISDIVNISIDYLKIYNIEELKHLLYDWQYKHQSNIILQNKLLELKDHADRIWLKLCLSINQDNQVSSNFILTQNSNYLILCEIFEDLRILFCYDYSEAKMINSSGYKKISEYSNRLSYCLSEKMLVKAVFEDYDLKYDKVKNQVFSYIRQLNTDLSKTYKVYGKNENEKP